MAVDGLSRKIQREHVVAHQPQNAAVHVRPARSLERRPSATVSLHPGKRTTNATARAATLSSGRAARMPLLPLLPNDAICVLQRAAWRTFGAELELANANHAESSTSLKLIVHHNDDNNKLRFGLRYEMDCI